MTPVFRGDYGTASQTRKISGLEMTARNCMVASVRGVEGVTALISA